MCKIRWSVVSTDACSWIKPVLTLARTMRDAIVAHACRDHPIEACGIIAGPRGSDRPVRHIPMVNAAASTTFYQFDPLALLRLYQSMQSTAEEPVVIYHSHPNAVAYPSPTDIALATHSAAHYLLIGTSDGADEGTAARPVTAVALRSFRIIDGRVDEEEICLADGPVERRFKDVAGT